MYLVLYNFDLIGFSKKKFKWSILPSWMELINVEKSPWFTVINQINHILIIPETFSGFVAPFFT